MTDVILIDGRSGAGKSDLASRLVRLIPEAQLVRLDDIYPGWDGLRAASLAVPLILRTYRWRSWDWTAGKPGVLHRLDPARPVIIEGVGALTHASRALATTCLWLETDDVERKRRALARDGDTFAPHWDRWAIQEERFLAEEDPRSLADVIVRT